MSPVAVTLAILTSAIVAFIADRVPLFGVPLAWSFGRCAAFRRRSDFAGQAFHMRRRRLRTH
jgi:hypothetical protein